MKKKTIFIIAIFILILIGCGLFRTLFYPPQVESLEVYEVSGESLVFQEWNSDLQKYVKDGSVDYNSWRKDTSHLEKTLAQLEKISRKKVARNHLLAAYINAYNACTVKLILEFPEIKSITDIPKPKRWDDVRWQIGERKVSLNQLEHDILRKEFIEPRIHFAIVCASIGCPHIADFAYEGETIDAQLTLAAQSFFAREENLKIEDNTIYLSSILNWFQGDFTKDSLATELKWFGEDYLKASVSERMLRFVVRFAPKEIGDTISQDYQKWSISYSDYDWNLNGI